MSRIVAVILLALVVTATWVLLHPVALPEPRTLHAQEDDWHLPSRPQQDSAALVAKIEQDRLWGSAVGAIPIDDKPLTAPNWRIMGVVSSGAERYLVLAIDGQLSQQIKIGDNLPGGIKVIGITADHVCILLNGKKRILKTYKE